MAAAGIGLALSGLSTVMGAVGSIQQGQAASRQAEYQAQVARNNQTIASQNANYASNVGETQAQAQDLKNRAQLGVIEAAQSASGLSFDSPTLRDVREGSANVLRMDTLNTAQNAQLRARAYTAQAGNYGAEAGLQTAAAGDARRAGTFGAVSSILSGGSSFAEKWSRYQTPSPGGGLFG
jgi:hypothetical protein